MFRKPRRRVYVVLKNPSTGATYDSSYLIEGQSLISLQPLLRKLLSMRPEYTFGFAHFVGETTTVTVYR